MQVKRSSMLPKSGRSLAELSGLPTSALLDLARSGDREAFDPLYRRFSGLVFRYVLNRVGRNWARAEDVASETWLTALRSIDTFAGTGEDDFRRWLLGVARFRSLKHFESPAQREIASEAVTSGDSYLEFAAMTAAGDDVDDPRYAALRARLRAAVEQLPTMQRRVTLMQLDGADCAEIMQVTSYSAGQVKSATDRARMALRRQLRAPLPVTSTTPDAVTVADTGVVSLDTLAELYGGMVPLKQAIATLPPVQRDVLRMRLDGVRQIEIAAATGRSTAAVGMAWRDGRRALHERLTAPVTVPAAAAALVDTVELRRAAESLPAAQRTVVLMRFDGAAIEDIAQAAGVGRNTVRMSWNRARDTLARQGLTLAPYAAAAA